ncbi:hypothetical protein VOLCADRAFT_108645 [Volvox carteri f. nagariensis]|uniref:Uncharacterized protein n=1 Tax=Volvox carteri f. nagariensis TaxID=3068 RepID=D8ULI7_VOLCA|nr:uncharacterized protein VOLCADRAFT_108645 [Volvox carteri f. nagariensis]EFJ39411.1 hypothetical protein VOLCADRAFT_108645 [Volvox carteri f. nagariensis]|eukprot:XP_002959523.1 hypothetical protein VOLCADRAFT_108645 [Volvox carteri f. nagariensis]
MFQLCSRMKHILVNNMKCWWSVDGCTCAGLCSMLAVRLLGCSAVLPACQTFNVCTVKSVIPTSTGFQHDVRSHGLCNWIVGQPGTVLLHVIRDIRIREMLFLGPEIFTARTRIRGEAEPPHSKKGISMKSVDSQGRAGMHQGRCRPGDRRKMWAARG